MTVIAPQLPPREPMWRLTVAQYHEMVERQMLTEDDPIELIEGWLLTKMSKNPPHRIATRKIARAIERLLPVGWYLDTQEPITTVDSEPEPDVVVARGDTTDYADRHPGSADVCLVVEVAEATLERDRTIKQRVYARAGIPVYWVVDLANRAIEVYTQPSGDVPQPQYANCVRFSEDQSVPVVIGTADVGSIPVRDMLP